MVRGDTESVMCDVKKLRLKSKGESRSGKRKRHVFRCISMTSQLTLSVSPWFEDEIVVPENWKTYFMGHLFYLI